MFTQMSRRVRLVQVAQVFMRGGAVIVPGLIGYLAEREISIYAVEIFFCISMLLCIVPSGVIAGKIGDKSVMLFGSLFAMLGPLLYLAFDTSRSIFVAEICMGVGLGFMFGSDESLMHRILAEEGSKLSYKEGWASTVAARIFFAALMYGAGEFLHALDPSYPFIVAFCNYSIIFLAVLLVKSPAMEVRKSDWRGLTLALRTSPMLRWVILRYGLLFTIGHISVWSYEEFFIESGAPLPLGFVLAAAAMLTVPTVGLVQRALDAFSPAAKTAIVAFLFALGFAVMGVWAAPWCFLLVLIISITKGYVSNDFSHELHINIDSKSESLRAALTSCRQMSHLCCYFFVSLLLGSGEAFTGRQQLLALAVLAVAFGTLLVVLAPKTKAVG